MKKTEEGTSSKSKKTTGTNPPNESKNKKGNTANSTSTTGATSHVKPHTGHGMANEGTTGTYEGEDR